MNWKNAMKLTKKILSNKDFKRKKLVKYFKNNLKQF